MVGYQSNMTCVLIKRGHLDRDMTQEEYHMKIKAEIRRCVYKPRNVRLPANYQKVGQRHGTHFPSQHQKKPTLLTT